jgi:hypothetical protein
MATKPLKTDNRKKVRAVRHEPTPAPIHPPTERANREWFPGLCTTCVNELDCTFPRSLERPLLRCEEFVGAADVRPSVTVPDPQPNTLFAVANREWFPGLCMTCEKLPVCTFPKPEGGVFNCDEFE